VIPANITLVPLPAKAPELNPVETIWQQMRGGFEICIDGLSIWLMRIARESGRGTSVQAVWE
jgi:transposase